MKSLLHNAAPGEHGYIQFHYRNGPRDRMPETVRDPLELLGDISRLCLGEEDRARLRAILRQDIAERGQEAVWQERTFRKNLILSQGRLV